jgi:hypothetical protein
MKFLSLILVSLLLLSCAKNHQDANRQEIQNKYDRFVNGLSGHITEAQTQILQNIKSNEAQGGLTRDELNFKQEDIDYLIRLKLIKLNTETRKYTITALGEDYYKRSQNK